MSDSDRILATYDVRSTPEEVAGLARRIAYEQTVELPPALVTDPVVCERVLGRVEAISSLEPAGGGHPPPGPAGASHRVIVSYSGELANGQLPQLLNLLYGNVSLYPGVALADFSLPPAVAAEFAGPRFGVEGLRRLTGVHGRPLLATALKPRGLPVAEYARIAGEFALGGGDLVKDDQNLVTDFAGFRERVLRCRDAVEGANVRSGRRCLYFPLCRRPSNRSTSISTSCRRPGYAGFCSVLPSSGSIRCGRSPPGAGSCSWAIRASRAGSPAG